MPELFDWVGRHETIFWWLAIVSALMFVASLILVPVLVARIPTDYFVHEERPKSYWSDRHPILRAIAFLVKNCVALVLVLAGIAMLVLPGQGILSIVTGIMLLSFPGKYRFEKWMIGRPPILRAINWLRRRSGRQPLMIEDR